MKDRGVSFRRGRGIGEGTAGATRRELEEHGEAAVFPSPPWFWQLRIFRKARRVSIGVAEKKQRVHEQEYEGDRVHEYEHKRDVAERESVGGGSRG